MLFRDQVNALFVLFPKRNTLRARPSSLFHALNFSSPLISYSPAKSTFRESKKRSAYFLAPSWLGREKAGHKSCKYNLSQKFSPAVMIKMENGLAQSSSSSFSRLHIGIGPEGYEAGKISFSYPISCAAVCA